MLFDTVGFHVAGKFRADVDLETVPLTCILSSFSIYIFIYFVKYIYMEKWGLTDRELHAASLSPAG